MTNIVATLDTIAVQFQIRLYDDFLKYWSTKRKYGSVYEQEFKKDEQHFHAVYCRTSYPNIGRADDPNPILNIYTSLPKLVFDCNHNLLPITSLDFALGEFDNMIKCNPEFSGLGKIETAKLIRFDVCVQFDLGEDIDAYLEAIKQKKYPYKKKIIYPTGVEFRGHGISVKIYKKYDECSHEEARGKLRVEVSVKGSKIIKKLTGKLFPTIRDITQELMDHLIIDALDKLNLSDQIICSESEAAYRISSCPDISRTIQKNLINYMRDNQTYGAARMKNLYSAPTVRKYNHILRELKISPNLINEKRILQPLIQK